MFKMGDQEVDVGELERRIIKDLIARQRDRYKRLSYDELSSLLSLTDAGMFPYLYEAHKLYEAPMRTRGGPIGLCLAFVGRVGKRLMAPLIYKQQNFNYSIVEALESIQQNTAEIICELKRDVEELRAARHLSPGQSPPRETPQ